MLNGFKLNGTIYSVHKIPDRRHFSRIRPGDNDFGLQEIFPLERTILFPDFDPFLVYTNDGLYLFPGWYTRDKELTVRNYLNREDYYLVCTHKRDSKHV